MTVLAPTIGAFFMGRSRRQNLSNEQIKLLSKHPAIKHVRNNRIVFTFEFRNLMYDYWVLNPSHNSIREFLKINDFDIKIFNNDFIHSIHTNFSKNGKPSGAKNKSFGGNSINYRSTEEINAYLLSTGKFARKNKGISFCDEFIQELYHEYPSVSIEDGLIKNNIDPEKVGYQRIYQLKLLFEGRKSSIKVRNSYSQEVIEKYANHPYVKKVLKTQFVLKDEFYNEAYYFNQLSIDEILEVFCIDHHDLNISLKNRIKHKLSSWDRKDIDISIDETHLLYLRVQRNRLNVLKKVIDSNFEKTKDELPTYPKLKKKALCVWISSSPKDDEYTITAILEKVGISRSNYYAILKKDDYGIHEFNKNKKDDEDIIHIENVIKYKDIPKGSRMIYMMLPRLEKVKMSRNKILRLMRKYDLTCKVRESKKSRIENRKLIEENKKENLLKRQFRLYKPFESSLTDVSYLKYGNSQTAYLSCVKDSSSGRILSVAVSNSQDLMLTDTTLEGLGSFPLKEDGIFHSDQGALYLTPAFQSKIKEMKLRQSMSRRGNCWDNASQESFFGHFKDECDYSDCVTLDDVIMKVTSYMDYYNNERPQWTRNKMTPVEFERYLLEMDDEDFDAYLKAEKEKYDLMRQKSIEKAKKRAKDLGAEESSMIYSS